MTTDIKYAAKAAGIDIDLSVSSPLLWDCKREAYWNPRTDDGDSRRLQVKLRIDMSWGKGVVRAERRSLDDEDIDTDVYFDPTIEGDDLRACREAVLAVAVQIGKGMK